MTKGGIVHSNTRYRGRLIDHVQLVVRDLAASKRFYAAVFAALEIPIAVDRADYFRADELLVSSKESRASAGAWTGRVHLAFAARDPAMVQRFFEAGRGAGGTECGPPGPRDYHPGYYAAFLLDPDGNNIEAVYHGPAQYSAPAIEIRF